MGPVPRSTTSEGGLHGLSGNTPGDIKLAPMARAFRRAVDNGENGKFAREVLKEALGGRASERGEELGRKREKRAGGGRETGGLRKSG